MGTQRPAPLTVPEGYDPGELMTLPAIARVLGLPERNLGRRYRADIEARIAPQVRGRYRYYPLGTVIDVLNELWQGPDSGSTWITLEEWRITRRLRVTLNEIRIRWRYRPGFPAPVGKRPTGRFGPDIDVYDAAELDRWLATDGPDQPLVLAIPYGRSPKDRMTLSAIARALGISDFISQYAPAIEERIVPEDAQGRADPGGHRRPHYFPVGAVIDVLNEIRQGYGVAADSATDRRRKANRAAFSESGGPEAADRR